MITIRLPLKAGLSALSNEKTDSGTVPSQQTFNKLAVNGEGSLYYCKAGF